MRILDKFFLAIGIVGIAGAIVAGFFGQRAASALMLVLLFLAWMVWITVEIVILRKSITLQPGYPPQPTKIRPRLSFLKDSLTISSARKNPLKISGEFLLWSECTIMLWVMVPPKGKRLRDSPNHRYLLAHHTGAIKDHEVFRNQFVLRHSSKRQRWEFLTSNDAAEYGGSLVAADGLEPGWHHFLISWDRARPRAVLLIDGGTAGSDVSNTLFDVWPEKADRMFVGTWVSEWEGHFCETKLLRLRIFDRFLTINDQEVSEQLRLKPRE